MDFRGLLRGAGVCSIATAVIILASYLVFAATNGFMGASTTPSNPDRILQMLQAYGNQIYSRLDLFSYFLWLPALMGLFVLLREQTPAAAYMGGTFAAFGVLGAAVSSNIGAAMIGMAQGIVTEGLKDRLATLEAIAFSFSLTAAFSMAVANLLWGMGLLARSGLSRIAGYLFLAGTALFVIADITYAIHQTGLFNTTLLLMNLAMIGAYTTAGLVLWQAGQKEPATTPAASEKTRAAGA